MGKQTTFKGRLHGKHYMAKENELNGIFGGSLSHNVMLGLFL